MPPPAIAFSVGSKFLAGNAASPCASAGDGIASGCSANAARSSSDINWSLIVGC